MESYQSCLYHLSPQPIRTKLIIFDLDGTLTTSPRGTPFDDQYVFFGDIPKYFLDLSEGGWNVAIMTNQLKYATQARKIASIVTTLNAHVFVATNRDIFYKPCRGMFDLLLSSFYQDSKWKFERLVYVGDASGECDPFPPYRWSDSDRRFAEVIGAEFQTPRDVIPRVDLMDRGVQEMVILVGNPGSMKSTTSKVFERIGHVVCSRDVLGRKLKSAAMAALASGKSVVIDATNPTRRGREEFFSLKDVSRRIVWCVRDGRPFNSLRDKPVPEIAYRTYSSRFEVPDPIEEKCLVEMMY